MIDTSTKSSEVVNVKKKEEVDHYLLDANVQPQKPLKIEPNVLTYRSFKDNEYAKIWEMNYQYHDSEYVIFSPEQVRIRYVVHFRNE